jgi:hypothetical protein
VRFEGASDVTPDDLAAPQGFDDGEERDVLAEAVDFIRDQLAEERQRTFEELRKVARVEGYSDKMLRRALRRAGAERRKETGVKHGRWFWSLPLSSDGTSWASCTEGPETADTVNFPNLPNLPEEKEEATKLTPLPFGEDKLASCVEGPESPDSGQLSNLPNLPEEGAGAKLASRGYVVDPDEARPDGTPGRHAHIVTLPVRLVSADEAPLPPGRGLRPEEITPRVRELLEAGHIVDPSLAEEEGEEFVPPFEPDEVEVAS